MCAITTTASPQKRLDFGGINRTTRDHVVGDGRDGGDLGGYVASGIAEAAESFVNGENAAVRGEVERSHADLDDLVARLIQTRGLDIEEYASVQPGRLVRQAID
ncbi:hypothetical protein ACVIW0_007413 [Bradyrhizobium sp. USDA 4454]